MKKTRIIREYSAGKGEVSDEYIIDVINTFWAKTSSLSQAISQASAYLQMDAGMVRAIADKWDVTMEEGVQKLSPITEGGWYKKDEEMDPADEYMNEVDKDLMDDEDMEMEGMYKNKDEEYDDMDEGDYDMMMDEYEDDEYYESVLRDDLVVKGYDGIIPKGTHIRVKKA